MKRADHLTPELVCYLANCYRLDPTGANRSNVPLPKISPELIEAIKAELARIDAYKLGASLAQRDYGAYRSRRVLTSLLTELEASGRLGVIEGRDTTSFTGTKSP